MKKKIIKKEIPNCVICKWYGLKAYNLFNPVKHEICEAQGFAYVSDVYNKNLCRKLFEKKDL